MHLLRVRPGIPRAEVLAELREAARWARGAGGSGRLREAALARLREVARGIGREALRDSPTVPPDPELLREAAALFDEGEAPAEAAACLEQAGEPARAAELYGKAGELSRMEALF